jgi:uncharacterized protein YlxW (UPF0749 family)
MSAKDENATKRNVPSRRNILLGGTTLAAASAFGAGVPVTIAQAQAQPAPAGRKPNILVIFGDDIGLANKA